MIPIRCIIVILLFTISITILIVGTTRDIQGCIIGGILSILISAIVTMGIMMRRRTVVKITRRPVVKDNIINNTALGSATAPTIIPMPTDIINPIYETV